MWSQHVVSICDDDYAGSRNYLKSLSYIGNVGCVILIML